MIGGNIVMDKDLQHSLKDYILLFANYWTYLTLKKVRVINAAMLLKVMEGLKEQERLHSNKKNTIRSCKDLFPQKL